MKRKISVSDQEMQDYYNQNRAKWESPEQVTFHEIVLLYARDNKDEVRGRAETVVKQAKTGTGDEFIELVKQYSEAGTRETQGQLGPLPRADLQENIANVAFTMDAGTVSEPIDTGRSFHIIRLDARTPATTRTLADPGVKQEVHDQVRDEKYRPRFDIYLKLWRENYIEVAPKYGVVPCRLPAEIAPANGRTRRCQRSRRPRARRPRRPARHRLRERPRRRAPSPPPPTTPRARPTRALPGRRRRADLPRATIVTRGAVVVSWAAFGRTPEPTPSAGIDGPQSDRRRRSARRARRKSRL